MIVTKLIPDGQARDFVMANESRILTIDDASDFEKVATLIAVAGNFKIITLDVPEVDQLQMLHDEAFDRKVNK